MTVQSVLGGRLSEEDEFVLAKGVAAGYQGCNLFMKNCLALGNFYPGMTHRGSLLGIFVQWGLDQAAAQSKRFYSSVKPNTIGNHFHSHFEFPSRVHLTSIYTGKRADRRGRQAVYRGMLAKFNGPDLFEQQNDLADVGVGDPLVPVYTQLLHGGWEKPIAIVLAIPDRNQRTYSLRPYALPLLEPDPIAAEDVSEKMEFAIRSQSNVDEQSRDEESA